MRIKIAAVTILAIVIGITATVLANNFQNIYQNFNSRVKNIDVPKNLVLEEIKKEISTPEPLRSEENAPSAFLTIEGTISWTNNHRAQESIGTLEQNEKLNASAKAKLDDMFENQYFEHESPSGRSVDDLVTEQGYEYRTVGENLALGNFENDRILVQAWMDSPGHRANILNENFTEIGVAVGRGVFEGKTTWLAVQHFAKPAPICSSPQESLGTQIDGNKVALDNLLGAINAKKQELDNYEPKNSQEYQKMVDEYNDLVGQYNNLLSDTKNLIDAYNQEVKQYNICISQ